MASRLKTQPEAEAPTDETTAIDTALSVAAGGADTTAAIGHPESTNTPAVAQRPARRRAIRPANVAAASQTAGSATTATRPSPAIRPPAGPAEPDLLLPPAETPYPPAAARIAGGAWLPSPEATASPAPETATPAIQPARAAAQAPAVPHSSVFPEGFLPSLGPILVPGSAVTPAAAARTPVTETIMHLPDAGDGIDRAAPVPAPPATWRYRKRRRAVVLLFLFLTVIVLVVGQILRNDETAEAVPQEPAAAPLDKARDKAPDKALDEATDEAKGKAPGKAPAAGFAFTGGYGPVLGSTGPLRRFKVAVERRLGPGDGRDFADEVDRILGDSRSWIAGRQFRLRRVPASVAAEFTIYLASAGASERMCAVGGLRTGGFTSCRLSGRVIINNDRWVGAVRGYGAPLAVYRAYAINHEVGHQLGHGHEACAGKGRPAPVMMQQTFGLKGCVANSWPYLRGERYAGNPVS